MTARTNWTPLQPSIVCKRWINKDAVNGVPESTKELTTRSTLLLMWRLDDNGKLRYLDALGDDIPAWLCFDFQR